jgi:hypothetical protein
MRYWNDILQRYEDYETAIGHPLEISPLDDKELFAEQKRREEQEKRLKDNWKNLDKPYRY